MLTISCQSWNRNKTANDVDLDETARYKTPGSKLLDVNDDDDNNDFVFYVSFSVC